MIANPFDHRPQSRMSTGHAYDGAGQVTSWVRQARQSNGHAYIGHSGFGGTVTELGVVGSYKVRLYHRQSGLLLAETWSTATGAYAFTGIKQLPRGYQAVAIDHSSPQRNAAIADLITPEPM